GDSDLVRFTQKNTSSVGSAPVYVALGDAWRSRVWHTSFSPKGQLPLVGDFNGDGKDDIVSFVQKPQTFGGKSIGSAPVWVAISTGNGFGAGRLWDRSFSEQGEIPVVGDFNFDGRDDVATFVHDHISGDRARNVYVALSGRSSFGRSFTWMSEFAGKDEVPAV